MSISQHADALVDLFMAAAYADHRLSDTETDYIRRMLEDLLVTRPLPEAICARIAAFDPAAYDLQAAAKAVHANPPMRLRRLLELVGYVLLSDGEMGVPEDRFIRKLGAAFGLDEDEYRDLTLDHESKGPRRTFTKMAVVPVPGRNTAR